MIASRSNAQRDITYRVARLQGLFSQKAKRPPTRSCSIHQSERFGALRRRDMVKYSVAVGQVHLPGRMEFTYGLIADPFGRVAFSRNFERFGGHINADGGSSIERRKQQGRCCAIAAAKVQQNLGVFASPRADSA